MIQPANQDTKEITVATRAVVESLTPEELFWVFQDLLEKRKTPDPNNPNLWSTRIANQTVWGILDEEAGPNGENIFTVLLPSDY